MTSVQAGMFVLTSVVAMQRHVDYVRRGYHWYVTGFVPARKAERLRVKFVDRYYVDEHRNVRARRRARGEGVAVLLMYRPCSSAADRDPSPGDGVDETVVGWTLLITEGEHPARALEKLKDALDESQRLTLGPYQLIRRTRASQVRPAWTWAKKVHRVSPSKARGRKSNALGPLVVRKRAVAFCMAVPSASDPSDTLVADGLPGCPRSADVTTLHDLIYSRWRG